MSYIFTNQDFIISCDVINNKAPIFTIPVINIEVNNGYNWSG